MVWPRTKIVPSLPSTWLSTVLAAMTPSRPLSMDCQLQRLLRLILRSAARPEPSDLLLIALYSPNSDQNVLAADAAGNRDTGLLKHASSEGVATTKFMGVGTASAG